MAVIRYSVDLAHSNFFVYWNGYSSGVSWNGYRSEASPARERVAYRGSVSIDPATGAILEVSWRAVVVLRAPALRAEIAGLEIREPGRAERSSRCGRNSAEAARRGGESTAEAIARQRAALRGQ